MQKKRGQFSLEIIHCDGFTSMSGSAQALYLQILSFCDDEGFTSQVRMCKVYANATDEDLQELIDREFIYLLGENKRSVAVVKHWWMNNYIRDGKIVPSSFSEREKVFIKPNGNYTLDEKEGSPLPPIKNDQKTAQVPSSYRTSYEQGTNKVRPTSPQHGQAPAQAEHPIPKTFQKHSKNIPSHSIPSQSNTSQEDEEDEEERIKRIWNQLGEKTED